MIQELVLSAKEGRLVALAHVFEQRQIFVLLAHGPAAQAVPSPVLRPRHVAVHVSEPLSP